MVSLRVYCVQKLAIEDLSYCFRIPVSYVPAYLGNSSCSLMVEQSEKFQSIQEVYNAETMPAKVGWSGLWDLQLRVNGQAPLERLCSLNHPIKVQLSENK